ncbi:hypothetical protein AVEN_130507-1 [Araneus ventricosus]|uniref:Uncharacterized protein n=1 Tax=Araneus ventricosus TaxID=182803 RepID=A0A4Y2EI42_ARAVE|nr:hypothetical protein AVEN_130507-1 [Araneus ventricosus]
MNYLTDKFEGQVCESISAQTVSKTIPAKLTRVSEKKSTNAQGKDEFSNYKADTLMLYVEAFPSLVPEKNLESDQTSSMMDLFIELKIEFAAFRKGIYSKVDSFSKVICPTDDTIQNEEPRPSLQQEIIETELKSETSTYASIAQTSSAIPESKFKVFVKYDVIGVTETWHCEDMDSWHLFDDRYLVYRKDRGSSANSNRRGGGVLVAIKKCFSSPKWTLCTLWVREYRKTAVEE